MKANELLFWLSARREGSWQQFRSAVEYLHSCDDASHAMGDITETNEFPLHQQYRVNLECLSHVEFFSNQCENGWRVTPPTLAVHPTLNGVRAILCGARSPELCARILKSEKELQSEIIEIDGSPSCIRIISQDISTLQELALNARVLIQKDTPIGILSVLRSCTPPSRYKSHTEFPQGADWIITSFNPINLTWEKIERNYADNIKYGVLRFNIYFQQPRFFQRWNAMTYEIPRGVAIFLLLHRRRQNILKYNPESSELSLPAICRPPRLIERALVLCSGRPPFYDASTSHLTYFDVPKEIVRYAAELLLQKLS